MIWPTIAGILYALGMGAMWLNLTDDGMQGPAGTRQWIAIAFWPVLIAVWLAAFVWAVISISRR